MKRDWSQNNCLVFDIFLIYNFNLFFRLTFKCLLLLVSFAFSNVGHYDTRMELLFYIAYSIFSGSVGHFVVWKRNNKIPPSGKKLDLSPLPSENLASHLPSLWNFKQPSLGWYGYFMELNYTIQHLSSA